MFVYVCRMSLKRRPLLLRSRRPTTTSTTLVRVQVLRRNPHSSSKANPPLPSKHGVVQVGEDLVPEPLPAEVNPTKEEEASHNIMAEEEEGASLSTKVRREVEQTLAEASESIKTLAIDSVYW